MFQIIIENQGIINATAWVWAILGISLAITLAVYVLRSIGLYKLAKKDESGLESKAFLAWIPLVWVYLAGRLCGSVKMFGKPVKKFALILLITFVVAEVTFLVYNVLTYFPLVVYFLQGGEVSLFFGNATASTLISYGLEPYYFDYNFCTSLSKPINLIYQNSISMGKALYIVYIVSDVLMLVSLVFTIFTYIALFKRYAPERYVMYSILAAVINPAFGIIVFIIRNRKPIKYEDFLRERYNRIYGNNYMNNPNPNGNPYNNPYNNPYGNPYGAQPRQPENPFEEFADKNDGSDEPFSEFDKKDDNND